jgi:hypothetical protein
MHGIYHFIIVRLPCLKEAYIIVSTVECCVLQYPLSNKALDHIDRIQQNVVLVSFSPLYIMTFNSTCLVCLRSLVVTSLINIINVASKRRLRLITSEKN